MQSQLSKNLAAYERAFTTGTKPGTLAGLQGRFIRMAKGVPDSLTDDPDRRIVFLVDSQTLGNLVGLSGYQVCMAVGWDPDYTRGKVNAGYRFALAVFPETGCKLGTWDHMLDAVVSMYPEIGQKLGAHRDPKTTAENLKAVVLNQITDLEKLDTDVLLTQRYEKLRGMGQYQAA
jgi:hypothetical protein